MKKIAIIVAGGNGNRMNAGIPKQFMLLGGLPVLMHTITCFHKADPQIELLVVLSDKEIYTWKELCNRYSFSVAHQIVPGGETRFHSVKNGLAYVTEKSIVAIHDGARPFASESLIKKCFSEAEKFGNAIPAIPVNESLRKINGDESEVADRSSYVIIQTPQCFSSEIIKTAYNVDYNNSFTDDASVAEVSGVSIHLIAGESENIKITYPIDLSIGESILKSRKRL